MFRSPNENDMLRAAQKPERMNQIGRKFTEIFDKLLNPNYYEGTPLGKHFRRIKSNGTSAIYVKDELEQELDMFCKHRNNLMNYLVGFTGMGKTTLLRNYFKIQDRDVHLSNERLVIYVSFYYASLNADSPQASVETEIVKYLVRAIKKIGEQFPEIAKEEELFWSELYDYIEDNKPVSLKEADITPECSLSSLFSCTNKKTIQQKREQLIKTCQENKLEYYSSLLKYLLKKTQCAKDIYFIFDDIESKEALFHRPVVEVARHMHSCFSCFEGDFIVKTLVSLRAYTYRSNVDRQLEARREQIQKNTIFKRVTVDLNRIFKVRFDELESELGTDEKAKTKMSYDNAVKQLEVVSNQINNSFGPLIINLANCNLCTAMSMYNSILVNTEWIAREPEERGKFQVSADNYKLTAKTVFWALACGNEIGYFEKKPEYFPNLLHNNKEEGAELFNLLIVRYLMKKGATDLYGETYVQRSDIIQDVAGVFINNLDTDIKIEKWQERITDSLNYLYDSGILLRSIYDIESIDCDQIERKYSRAFKFYVSPRGKILYELLSQNALLLELYRDDIYVDLEYNDRLTVDMRTYDVIRYLILYVERLFEYEKKNLAEAYFNLKRYQEFFGVELLVCPLLEGLIKNIQSYFKNDIEALDQLLTQVGGVVDKIQKYCDFISETQGVDFKLSDYIVRTMNVWISNKKKHVVC